MDYSKRYSASSCVIITRPPEIIACFYIARAPVDLFVVFDSHPRPNKHPHGAAFIFKNSLDSTAGHLSDLLRYDESLLSDSSLQWQAQLLAQASGEVFMASEWVLTNAQWAEVALDASLQVLDLRAQMRELDARNQNLEADNRRLSEEVLELEERQEELEEMVEKLKRAKTRKVKDVLGHRPTQSSSSTRTSHASQSPLGTQPPDMNGHSLLLQPGPSSPRNEWYTPHVDPLAAQMQRDFDEESKQLERQFRHLQDTQPTFFDCGICMDRFQEDSIARVMPCGHPFCRSCLRDWAVSKIQDHRYPILCPTCMADKGRSEPGGRSSLNLQAAPILTQWS